VADPKRIAAAHRPSRSSRPPASPDPPTGLSANLLFVAGLSPQVITETLYCLLVQRQPPVDVRELHVLTTCVGKRRVCDDLLSPTRGWFPRFCREYSIPRSRIRFDARTIHVVTGANGAPLEDVRTPEDNARVADAVLGLVRDLTRDPTVALHASVAGGRKTMGLLLGIAFQFLARPQDRLSHVLVSPPALEGDRHFFYPPPTPTVFRVRGGRVRSRDVRVELAEIPVLLLRDHVQAIGVGERSYSDLIALAQRALDRQAEPPALLLDAQSRAVQVAEATIPLTPLEFAVYALLARRRLDGCGRPDCAGCERCAFRLDAFLDASTVEQLRTALDTTRAHDYRTGTLAGWDAAKGDPRERFLQVRSRINRKVRQALGPGRWVDRYLLTAAGKRGATLYCIAALPDRIRLA
jgi:CRISPR-associated protein (TIGR02584 family)